jgi:hypothetical protein
MDEIWIKDEIIHSLREFGINVFRKDSFGDKAIKEGQKMFREEHTLSF